MTVIRGTAVGSEEVNDLDATPRGWRMIYPRTGAAHARGAAALATGYRDARATGTGSTMQAMATEWGRG